MTGVQTCALPIFLTCGTCLNFYGLTEKLAVGGVTNMYVIAEKMLNAGNVVKP